MREHYLKRISDHLGHNYSIHADVYCLQSCPLERTKVARILLAVENGHVQSLRGKSLGEIKTDKLPVPFDYNDELERMLMVLGSRRRVTLQKSQACENQDTEMSDSDESAFLPNESDSQLQNKYIHLPCHCSKQVFSQLWLNIVFRNVSILGSWSYTTLAPILATPMFSKHYLESFHALSVKMWI